MGFSFVLFVMSQFPSEKAYCDAVAPSCRESQFVLSFPLPALLGAVLFEGLLFPKLFRSFHQDGLRLGRPVGIRSE